MRLKLQLCLDILSLQSKVKRGFCQSHRDPPTVFNSQSMLILTKMLEIPPKTAYSCKTSARPSKAELTVTKSDDIIVRPCVRYESCKINIIQIIQYYC